MAAGAAGFLFSANCPTNGCPGYALANPWILRGERGLAIIVGSVAIVSVLWRMLYDGKLPEQIGREGLSWKRTAKTVNENVADVLATVKSLDADHVALKADFEKLKKRVEEPGT